jgi:hypothetical protein
MHLRHNGDITVANTTTETSILGASQAGSTKTVEAGLARVGLCFLIRITGRVQTTGTPTLNIRVKLGSTTLAQTTARALANNTASSDGGLSIESFITIDTVGAAAQVRVHSLRALYGVTIDGAVNQIAIGSGGLSVVDLTVAQTFDVTVEWGTASPSNSLAAFASRIDMSR